MNAPDDPQRPKPDAPLHVVITVEDATQPVPEYAFVDVSRLALQLIAGKLNQSQQALDHFPVIPGLADTPRLERGIQYVQYQFAEAGFTPKVGMAAALRFLAVMRTSRFKFRFADLRVGHEGETLFWAPCSAMLAAAATLRLQLPRIEDPSFDEEEIIQASYEVHRLTDRFDESDYLYISNLL